MMTESMAMWALIIAYGGGMALAVMVAVLAYIDMCLPESHIDPPRKWPSREDV